MYTFDENTDYKTAFTQAADQLIAEEIEDRGERIAKTDQLCEAYARDIGKTPDAYELVKLANYLLREELGNKDSAKVRKAEYPFLSEDQQVRRMKKEAPLSKLEHAIDSCGKQYGQCKRRSTR